LEKTLAAIEERFGKLDMLFGKSQLDTTAPTNVRPEIDNSDFLDDDGTTMYQSSIGILHWAIELGHIDLAQQWRKFQMHHVKDIYLRSSVVLNMLKAHTI
jgi:hypothetical protein